MDTTSSDPPSNASTFTAEQISHLRGYMTGLINRIAQNEIGSVGALSEFRDHYSPLFKAHVWNLEDAGDRATARRNASELFKALWETIAARLSHAEQVRDPPSVVERLAQFVLHLQTYNLEDDVENNGRKVVSFHGKKCWKDLPGLHEGLELEYANTTTHPYDNLITYLTSLPLNPHLTLFLTSLLVHTPAESSAFDIAAHQALSDLDLAFDRTHWNPTTRTSLLPEALQSRILITAGIWIACAGERIFDLCVGEDKVPRYREFSYRRWAGWRDGFEGVLENRDGTPNRRLGADVLCICRAVHGHMEKVRMVVDGQVGRGEADLGRALEVVRAEVFGGSGEGGEGEVRGKGDEDG